MAEKKKTAPKKPKSIKDLQNIEEFTPEPKPQQIDKTKPSYEIPLQELTFGKSGVSDLFEKTNEILRYLNALKSKPKTP